MYKFIIFAILFATTAVAQTKPAPGGKKTTDKNNKAIARKDSIKPDTAKYVEPPLPHEFLVYTKKPRTPKERTKLCINLISGEKAINYCMNDSLCKDPESYKVLFEKRDGDSLYVLVLVDAFTKIDANNDDGRCNAGKETKLVFARWNTQTDQAKWRQKNVSSCRRGITNMSKDAIPGWDGSSVLTVSCHRGPSFYDIIFDPGNYKLGLQSSKDSETEAK